MGIAVFGLLGFLFYRERSRRPASTPTEQGREEQGREKAVRDPARMSVQEILGVERIQPQEMNAEERNA